MEQHRNNDGARGPKRYQATLSQSQGRSGYSVIFRHPVRRDEATGKPGVRVRRGLGTRDEGEALRLCAELNEVLGDPRYHNPAARTEAERRFDSRVVDMFFYKLGAEELDVVALRDDAIPLPPSEPHGYRHVLMLGTTGAGKTTLVRQLIGTDPDEERFPSTSTAKTTTHDTEIILDDGPWRAVVTFVSSDETREYLNECISAAALAAYRGADEQTVLRRLLSHVNQRYRFNYILGNGPKVAARASDSQDDDEDEEDEKIGGDADRVAAANLYEVDLATTNEVLARAAAELPPLAHRLADQLRGELNPRQDGDERVVEEIFEEELDSLLREDETFHELADSLMDEIEKRFDMLPPGELRKTRQGWPLTWSGQWPIEQRSEFLRALSSFASNYAPFFGRLLTPLVNGLRVAGTFAPKWVDGSTPKLVLLDGEGLGHSPKTSASVSTAVSRRIDAVDAVLLVDNAAQPMQAASLAAMREVVATGNTRKLIVAFTHFDEVRGDSLANVSAKKEHVLASAENVLATFSEQLGPQAGRALRKRLEDARFFLADMQAGLSYESPQGKRTIRQLRGLLDSVDQVVERPILAEARPVYDRLNAVLAIRSAALAFHESWWPLLGLETKPGVPREHWTRLKALCRRLATGTADEYDSLRPVADLRKELLERIYVLIQNPVRWEGPESSEEEKQGFYDLLAETIGRRFLDLSTRRVWKERSVDWQSAFERRGAGSTFARARIIGSDIYDVAAPVPDVTPSPSRNEFLHQVVSSVEEAAEEVGARFL